MNIWFVVSWVRENSVTLLYETRNGCALEVTRFFFYFSFDCISRSHIFLSTFCAIAYFPECDLIGVKLFSLGKSNFLGQNWIIVQRIVSFYNSMISGARNCTLLQYLISWTISLLLDFLSLFSSSSSSSVSSSRILPSKAFSWCRVVVADFFSRTSLSLIECRGYLYLKY